MRVFVTGAAGFIGTVTTKELIAGGHQVLGLARSDANAAGARKAGRRGPPRLARGSRQPARRAPRKPTRVIHLAFIHDFTKFAENGQVDKRAIEAMGDVLEGSGKPFIVTSGTGLIAPGRLATEDMRPPASPHLPRVSEQVGLSYAARGVRAMTIRLPQVHGGDGKAGLITYLLDIAREVGAVGYVGDGGRPLALRASAGCRAALPARAGEGRRRRRLSRRRRGRRADAPNRRGARPRPERAGEVDQEGGSRTLFRPARDVRRPRLAGVEPDDAAEPWAGSPARSA